MAIDRFKKESLVDIKLKFINIRLRYSHVFDSLIISKVATLIVVIIDSAGRDIIIESKMHSYRYEIQHH